VLLGGGFQGSLLDARGGFLKKNLSPFLPQMPQANIAQDTAQPPAYRLWLAQPLDVVEGDEESVLNGVLGLRSAAQDAQR
jgi:hypothetical protein